MGILIPIHSMANHTKFRFTEALKTEVSIELTVEQYLARLQNAAESKTVPTLYEYFSGPCVPYYDFDNSYPTQAAQEAAQKSDTDKTIAAVTARFGKAEYLWRTSHGHDPIKNTWKNSFHCIVRGVGYYKQGKDIPVIEGCDTSVYHEAGLWQKFRALGASKEGQRRPALRFAVDKSWDVVEWANLLDSGLGEKFEENFIQYIGNEKLVKVQPAAAVPGPKYEVKRDAQAPKDGRLVSVEEIREHIANMAVTRPAHTSDSRHKVVWALANYAKEINIDLRAEAHQFRRLDAVDYDTQHGFASTETCYGEAKEERGRKSGIQTILALSKEDNHQKYIEIVEKYLNKDAEVIAADEFEFFTDYSKMVGKTVTLDTVKAWASATMVAVVAKTKKVYLIKHLEGDIRDDRVNNVNYNVVGLKDLKEITDIEIKCPNPNFGKPKQPLMVDRLVNVVEWMIAQDNKGPIPTTALISYHGT